jgi:DNA-directed RNA polymerase specialized sigma24 family protein
LSLQHTQRSELPCPACIDQLTRFQTGLLEEADTAVIAEHLSSCPSCRLFSDQVETVAEFVGSADPTPVPDNLAVLFDDVGGSPVDRPDDLTDIVRSLYSLAETLDPDTSEDLVQATLLAALENGRGGLELSALAQDLTDRAFGLPGPEVRSLYDYETRTETRGAAPDPDGDTAELFYPDFYEAGPDAGRHVDVSNRWGPVNTLSPEDDVFTADLYKTVESAIAVLQDPLRQMVQLVDIDNVPVLEAAQMLRLDKHDAVDALHRARIHLRGVVDQAISFGT